MGKSGWSIEAAALSLILEAKQMQNTFDQFMWQTYNRSTYQHWSHKVCICNIYMNIACICMR